MVAANDGSEVDDARQEELAKKLARLPDEKRQKCDVQVYNAIDARGEASHEYRLGLAKTYLQGLPPGEEAKQIKAYNAWDAVFWRCRHCWTGLNCHYMSESN